MNIIFNSIRCRELFYTSDEFIGIDLLILGCFYTWITQSLRLYITDLIYPKLFDFDSFVQYSFQMLDLVCLVIKKLNFWFVRWSKDSDYWEKWVTETLAREKSEIKNLLEKTATDSENWGRISFVHISPWVFILERRQFCRRGEFITLRRENALYTSESWTLNSSVELNWLVLLYSGVKKHYTCVKNRNLSN